MDGLVVVDKPAGCTSHDVVDRCRRIFSIRRVGHGGTLDPDATGVLLVGLGSMTRLLRFVATGSKSYTAQVVLGVATTTLDSSGEVVQTWDMSGVTVADARRAAASLTGRIEQVPPMVSALKVGGRRLHELARQGVEVERPPREVTVDAFEVEPGHEPGVLEISVTCSAGTYIRTLAADLGAALGGGAHLRSLRRSAVGPFRASDARPLEDLGPEAVISPSRALAHLPEVVADDELSRAISHGAVLAADTLGVGGEGPWMVTGAEGRLLAVYERHGGDSVKPAVVMAPAEHA